LFVSKNENSDVMSIEKMKRRPLVLFKILITVLLLGFVYSQLEIDIVFARISSIELFSLVSIAVLYFTSQLINSLKWRLFLFEAGIEVSFSSVFKAFFLGMFINTFGIGTIGGDLARAMAIPCKKGFRAACVATVLADRIFGLLMLLLIGAISLIIVRPAYVPDVIIYSLFAVILMLFSCWIFGPRVLLFFIPDSMSVKDHLRRCFNAFPKRPVILFSITCISALFHSIQIYLAIVIFKSIHAPITFSTAFSSIPFINIASSLPITINGIGVREAVGIYILQPAGVVNETTVVFAAVWLLVVTFVSGVIGVIVIPSYGDRLSGIIEFRKEEIKSSEA
jgi:glycosyltransferase 2 family protein